MSSHGTPKRRIEELDWSETAMGELLLRRRFDPVAKREVYEVRLGDEYLMSSLFTVAERALARLGLADTDGDDLHVLVGGLGLGYTAAEALLDRRVGNLVVVEALDPVISWHRKRLVPAADAVAGDPRTTLAHGDFFALCADGALPTCHPSGRLFDAALVDIDHTPDHRLADSHAGFYTAPGLESLCHQLAPCGVFALWSDDPPDDAFLATARQVFGAVEAHVIDFPNPLTGGTSSNTVYVANRPHGHRT